MIRCLVTPVRNFMGLILIGLIAVGGAWAQNGNPGPESPPDVSKLIQQLKSLDTHERVHAAREFEQIKPLPPEAIKALVEMLRTAPYDEAQFAIKALSGAGPRAIPPLAALANTGNQPAVWTLGRMAFSEPAAWPVLIGLSKSDFSGIRSAAASGLAIAGPPVVPLLVKALADDDPRMRAGAAETLVHMRLRPTNEVGVRYAKPGDLAPAAPQLAKLLNDPDAEVRDNAALALAYADPSDKRAAPILGQMLDRGASSEAIAALQNMGINSKSAVPALERVLAGNRYSLMCANAARALAKIGGAEACAPLAQAIVGSKNDQARGWVTDATNSINEVRIGAANAIVEISPACPQTIPILIATLGKPWSASSALAKLGGPAIPALIAASKSPNLSVRKDAVQTLAAIRPVSPAAVRALTLALRDGGLDLDSRQAAVDALADIKPLTPDAVDGLMLALKEKSDTITSTAAKALQDMGGEAGQAAHAELKHEQTIEAQRSEPDTRSYSNEELIATIQDPDLEYALTLTYLVPILPAPAPIDDAPFVVTVHTAEDQNERLSVWKKTGVDRYQKMKVMAADPDNQEHFHVPITFQAIVQVTAAGGHQSEERELFVEIPVEWYRNGEERVFAVDGDGLRPVEIEAPEEMVPNPKQIPLKYQTASRGPYLGSYHRLDWSFLVSNEDDPTCCPSGGEVSGTYKIVKDATASPPTWKMVVETAKFNGPEEAAGTFGGVERVASSSARELGKIGKPAMPALTAALKSSDLNTRQAAAEGFASMNAVLTPEATNALTIAHGDEDSVVRSRAARSLRNAGGTAEQTALAEEKREKEADEAAHPEPHIPPVAKFSKEQIIAPIPADANYKYPLKLALFAPISGYVVTLHIGKDRPERLVFWKVVDDKYQKLVLRESDPHSGEHFQVPTSFDATIGSPPPDSFFDVATLGRGGVTDKVFHIDDDDDRWQQIEIESPEDSYKNKLRPSETVRHRGRNFFSDDKLEFEFQIWNSNDQDCCPTAGRVIGTYKIVRAQTSTAEAAGEVHGGFWAVAKAGVPNAGAVNDDQTHGEGMHSGQFVIEPNPVPTWKMVVDTAKRQH